MIICHPLISYKPQVKKKILKSKPNKCYCYLPNSEVILFFFFTHTFVKLSTKLFSEKEINTINSSSKQERTNCKIASRQ